MLEGENYDAIRECVLRPRKEQMSQDELLRSTVHVPVEKWLDSRGTEYYAEAKKGTRGSLATLCRNVQLDGIRELPQVAIDEKGHFVPEDDYSKQLVAVAQALGYENSIP